MTDTSSLGHHFIKVTVDPGICGFPCIIEARRVDARNVLLRIRDSACEHIENLSRLIKAMTLRELFAPVSKNPAFTFAETAGCHPSCPIPVAILKAAEVAMDMALPRDVRIRFQINGSSGSEKDKGQ